MSNQTQTTKAGDASGRGSVAGYRVNFPARMRTYTEAEINAVANVMRNAEVQTQGDYMRKFEADFKAYTGANHAFAVDNCTNALRMTAILCNLKPGDEVIVPGYTFSATAIPFGYTGAQLVFADIDPERWTIDPKDIEKKITPRTKVIVAVHLLGMPVDMPAVMDVARRHNLRVIEDCAQRTEGRFVRRLRLFQFSRREEHHHARRGRRTDRQIGRGRGARARYPPQRYSSVRARPRTLLGPRHDQRGY
jgi:perosamine synthetase